MTPITSIPALSQNVAWTLIGYIKDELPYCFAWIAFMLVIGLIINLAFKVVRSIRGGG